MGSDFIDTDLAAAAQTRRAPAGAGHDVNQLVRQKEHLVDQVVSTAKEIEHHRIRKEALEKEKAELESLARRQEEYEQHKADIIEKLSRAIVLAEKEEQEARRMAELMAVIRGRFQETLVELQAIDENAWPEDLFSDELSKASVIVEDARAVYKNALAKVDAEGWQKGMSVASAPMPVTSASAPDAKPGFAYWIKVGLAVSLPLMALLLILFVVYLLLARA